MVFQHGLGADRFQVAEFFPAMTGVRRLTLECRGHGRSEAGSRRPFSIALFADDVIAACDALGIDRFVVGGMSMGAAIALDIAARHRDRVTALVIARPAWVDRPGPANMAPFAEVAACLRAAPPEEARARFETGQTARELAISAPDNLASLLGFFARADAALTADLLGDIAADGPGVSRETIAALDLPALVLGNAVDAVHPLGLARDLAALLPRARFTEITSKARDRERHFGEFRAAVAAFLTEVIPGARAAP
ncbi:alpha/beta fold hydrolase [Methylobrevis pamukkalensis]|uniref:Haloalkane dehalogenase n=1 Tax=Methylobrevis pamukkalensis TaxID=1439726 RepID=A0A1E3H1F3_9HYPH|nr:alpha/beta hydrolase [Methylobrevis pamukkalensis]ODN69965.1 haloalkane dehalogenase [Methylobrevis pamukkalensis]